MGINWVKQSGGSGGVSGGGASSYSSTQADLTATYTSAETLTLTGLPSGLDITNFVQVSKWDADGKETVYTPLNYAFGWNDSTGVLTVTGATFAATDQGYNVYIDYIPKGYDPSTDEYVVHVVNPGWLQESRSTPVDITGGGTDGTYYYYLSMSTFRKVGLQLKLDSGSGSVTVTVEATIQDGSDITALDYLDLTNDVFGAASFTADAFLGDNAGKLGLSTYFRIKVVANTSGANDANWTVDAKRIYG